MAKTTNFANAWLQLYFNAVAIANIADNTATSPLTNIVVSLHSGDPGVGGNQTTNEISYTGYGRQNVARTSGGWTVSTNTATNAGLISFPKSTGVADNTTAEYWGIGRSLAGAGTLDYSGPLASALLGAGVSLSADNTTRIPGLSGLAVNDKLVMIATPNSPTPGGLSTGTVYFAKTVSGDTITLSATSGGATITITADGTGYWARLSPLQITLNVQPQITTGNLVVTEV